MKRYKRFNKTVTNETLHDLFNELTTEGWDIIYYNEIVTLAIEFNVTIVCSKSFG